MTHESIPFMTKCLHSYKLLGKFIKIHIIQNTVTLNEIVFLNPVNQLPDENLFIDFTTKNLLTKLENDGDICSTQRQIFYKAVHAFYDAAPSDISIWRGAYDLKMF